MQVFIVVEEDSIGARASKVYCSKVQCEDYIKETFPDLRYLTEDAWRAGSVIISIQTADLDVN
jgi:hypothetical protein